MVSLVLALWFVLALRWGAYGMLLAELIAAALLFLQAGRYLLPNLGGHFQPAMLRTSFIYGVGVLPSHLVSNFATLTTSSILADELDMGAVGQLAIARRFALPLTVLASSFQTAFLPIYFSLRADHTPKNVATLVRTARLVWAGAIGVAIGATFLIPPILKLVMPVDFDDAAELIPIMVIGFLAQTVYSVFAPEIYFTKKTYLVPIGTVVSVIVSIVFTVLTVKTMGAAGVAWANSLGLVALAVMAVILSRRLVSIPHQPQDLLRLVGCGIAAAGGGWIVAHGTGAGQFIVGQLAAGIVAIVTYPALLWFCADPTVREAARLLDRR